MSRTASLIAVAFLATLPAVAAATTIADIVNNPNAYANTQVTVVGTVILLPLGFAGESMYTIAADDRRITVVSKNAAPAVGEHLEVSGKIGLKAPDDEFTWPPVIAESGRQPAP